MMRKNVRQPWNRKRYTDLVSQSLRHVVRDILADIAHHGLCEPNHYYISFRTDHSGVLLPENVRQNYPKDMTIILQNRFDGLDVNDDTFSVTLWFHANPARISLPFAAITSFVDPSFDFVLRFDSWSSSVLSKNQEDPSNSPEIAWIGQQAKPLDQETPSHLGSSKRDQRECQNQGEGVVIPIDRFQKRKNRDQLS